MAVSKTALEKSSCPVCGSTCSLAGEVDFNKSCEEFNGMRLQPSGEGIAYVKCGQCYFCFAPQMYEWPLSKFVEKIYNSEYEKFDPDYASARPQENAARMIKVFPGKNIKHLDFGGGSGLLSSLLKKAGWNSLSHDVMADNKVDLTKATPFNLITAFEVFEHVPDVNNLMSQLCSLLSPFSGLIYFSTLLSDDIIAENGLEWLYIAPRNGHISIFSKKSLELLAKKFGLKFARVWTQLIATH